MPPYTLAPVTAADRETISTIFCASYATNPYFRLQYPALTTAELIPGFSLRFPAGKLSRPNTWHLKLLDAALDNKPVAFARWELPAWLFKKLSEELGRECGRMGIEGESQENLRRFEREREEGYVDGEPKGMNPRVPDEFIAEMKIMCAQLPPPPAEYIGTSTWKCFFPAFPYPRFEKLAGKRTSGVLTWNTIELEALHTLPDHERKGAGSTLLEWGIRLADKENLPIRLSATSHGIGLYKKFGFVELMKATFDLARWGGEGYFYFYEMSREPNFSGS